MWSSLATGHKQAASAVSAYISPSLKYILRKILNSQSNVILHYSHLLSSFFVCQFLARVTVYLLIPNRELSGRCCAQHHELNGGGRRWGLRHGMWFDIMGHLTCNGVQSRSPWRRRVYFTLLLLLVYALILRDLPWNRDQSHDWNVFSLEQEKFNETFCLATTKCPPLKRRQVPSPHPLTHQCNK